MIHPNWKHNVHLARQALEEMERMAKLARSQTAEAVVAKNNAATSSRAAIAEADRVLAWR